MTATNQLTAVKKNPRCLDGCLVAEARGAHCACEKECAYADKSTSDICRDLDDELMENGDATWCHDPDMGAR